MTFRNENSELAKLSMQRCVRCLSLVHFEQCGRNKHSKHGVNNKCLPCIRAVSRERYHADPQASLAASKRWAKANPQRVRQFGQTRRAKPLGYLNARVRTSIHRSLNGTKCGRRWELILGYSAEELKQHIERQFLPRMGWHNRELWHIDHITPLAAFDLSGDCESALRKAWALPNLRPMWAMQNLKKGTKRVVLL